MVRPTFSQNTWTMPWNAPSVGPVATQVFFEVDDPFMNPFQTDTGQFEGGFVELMDNVGNSIVVGRVLVYTNAQGDDAVTINIPSCAGGQSGLACLGGVTSGTSVFSDDDLSVQGTFEAKIWGCDDLYAAGGAALLPPDMSALELRYGPAYIKPVHETAVSGVGGIGTFLRNVNFGLTGSYGQALWDQALPPVRNLPASTAQYWTTMVLVGWQAEEDGDDGDPNTEFLEGSGVTYGISTHRETLGVVPTSAGVYTGMCAVLRATVHESTGREKFTVAHEIGHTFGLEHDPGMMCENGPCQVDPFGTESLKKLREYMEP
jgi:hypothetical protein